MFDGLQSKLTDVFHNLRGEGRVTEETLNAALRQIRLALLEADVHIRVVRPFIDRVRERSLGADVLGSLTAAQQVVKIVRDELTGLLGEESQELVPSKQPTVVLMCGLQGSGKTTTSGKLALRLKGQNRHPLLVAGDLQRAAAVEQLIQVGSQVDVPVVAPEDGEKVQALAKRALKVAKDRGHDLLIFDTAGRLHVDDELMRELEGLVKILDPQELFFVADSMTGQDAVRSAESFQQSLDLTGVILTKMDGDSRGGAALSIRTVTRLPIRFVGVGEKLEELELFHPQRLAGRMIGMGDVMSLIEKAERGIDKDEAERLAQKLVRQEFTLEDLRDQLRAMRRMGPLKDMLKLLPKAGMFKGLDASQVDDGQFRRIEAIINSMTPDERRRPQIINPSRKKRVARGSGTSVVEINRLLKQYKMMRKMMKGSKGKMMRKMLGGGMGGDLDKMMGGLGKGLGKGMGKALGKKKGKGLPDDLFGPGGPLGGGGGNNPFG
ncbi:MAG: signal recognition particle protein [Acidobacteriota bacterium]|nr:signal recognition particle protein [Acidobacteriota bacterium]